MAQLGLDFRKHAREQNKLPAAFIYSPWTDLPQTEQLSPANDTPARIEMDNTHSHAVADMRLFPRHLPAQTA